MLKLRPGWNKLSMSSMSIWAKSSKILSPDTTSHSYLRQTDFSPVTFTMKQSASPTREPAALHSYRPESLAVASRICSHSWSMSVRLSGPSEEPSLVQTMAAASGSGQLSFSSSPGCTEHRVGLEFWFLVGGSAERRAGGKGAQKRERKVGEKRNKHECKTHNTTP